MPDLNLNDEDSLEEQPSEEPSQPESTEETSEPPRRERGGEMTRMIVILVVLGVLAGAVYMVNKLGIVKLWGTSDPIVAQVEEPPVQEQAPVEETAEPPAQEPSAQQPAQQAATPAQQQATPAKPVETPPVVEKQKTEMPMKLLDPIVFPNRQRATRTVAKQEAPAQQPVQIASTQAQEPPPERKMEAVTPAKTEPAPKQTPVQTTQPAQTKPAVQPPKVNMANLSDMTGTYTVQVYALRDKGNAEAAVQRLNDAGYPAFVEEINAREMMWYTVRVGKFPSAAEAKKAVENFAQEIKMHHFIDKVRLAGN